MKYTILFSLCGLLALVPGKAFSETIESALKQCSNQQNSLQRLVCYDRVVKDINQYSGLEEAIKRGYPVPSVSSENRAPAPAPRASFDQQKASPSGTEFGLEHKKPINDDIESLTGSIVKTDKTLRDKYVITLDNGTVWQQTDDDTLKLEAGHTVTIERGLLGAFYLSRSDVNRRMKVKRVN